ncbi:hypothetical protein ALO92_200000 [Pseudomonas congelans]|uniref:Uncharacterized protein n=1 Tax=Pseudomonas congelans TaxID=200452 RepID=A0A0P9MU93_9PSED|nr:hypothetical protein ALO92_200000 [Pseudomonas congelans]
MPFQLDQHRGLLAPFTQDLGQRRQQQVVDLRAVRGRRDFQQLVGQVTAQPGRCMRRVTIAHRAFGFIARQRLVGALQGLQPVIALGRQRLAGRIRLQLLGPTFERRSFCGECYRLALRQGEVRLLQVFQQHPP